MVILLPSITCASRPRPFAAASSATDTLFAEAIDQRDSPLTTVCSALALADGQKASADTAMAPRKGLTDTKRLPCRKVLTRSRFRPSHGSPPAGDGYVSLQEKLRSARFVGSPASSRRASVGA